MLIKIILVVLFITSKCFCEDLVIIAFNTTEDGIANNSISGLERLEKERYEIQKQVNASTSNGTTTNPVLNPNPIATVVNNVYSRIPCSCLKGQCACCTGPLLDSFNQKACLNITYEPDEFAFNAAMSINGQVFYNNRISGKNPPPICIRIPRIRIVKLCARFSNVYFTGPNMHTCVGMEASFGDYTIFETLLGCFRIGSSGVALVPPEDGGGISGAVDEDDDYDDDYDDSARGFGIV